MGGRVGECGKESGFFNIALQLVIDCVLNVCEHLLVNMSSFENQNSKPVARKPRRFFLSACPTMIY